MHAAVTRFGPWPDKETAQAILHGLAGSQAIVVGQGNGLERAVSAEITPTLQNWLAEQGLGPIVRYRYAAQLPQLADALQVDAMLASAENELYLDALQAMLTPLDAAGIEVTLLKGVALALSAYPQPALRTMSDVDVWIEADAIERAIACLDAAGFEHVNRPKNTEPLHISHRGKIKFNLPGWRIGGVEIHTNPFAITAVQRTSRVDLPAMWARTTPLNANLPGARQPAAEDMIIHVAVHLAVSNQFCFAALRGLLDVALLARRHKIDWQLLAKRAQQWRLSVPVWLVLSYAAAIFDLFGADEAIEQLQPSRMRQQLIGRYVTLDRILSGYDFRPNQNRHLYLALMVDRPF
jgi:hypothetical protein